MSNDSISRCELFNRLATIPAPPEANDFKAQVYMIIQSMETSEKWIPCSEKLPANDDWVIISVLDEVGDTPYRYSDFGWYFERAKCWIVESEQRTDVVAYRQKYLSFLQSAVLQGLLY